MTRLHDWPERLAELIQQRLASPFAWGSNDCCLFAADAILATTGEDPAAALRGAYSDAAGALGVLNGRQPADLAGELLGDPLPTPALAHRGDIVCHETDGRQTLGVCVGDQWCAPGDEGLVFQPMSQVRLAWRV
jgi:hypothetical protein